MSTETVILDCARCKRPDIATIDRIARTRLEARRRGCEMRLRNPNVATLELIALLGLERVLGVEVQRQPE
ncbi:MAG TPA: STAS domain-containing protein [Candidatus Dormibacteraeota bacterium]|nr:STAS domain-containing protein [Candidatus Dormibacteraeota bacterium]